MQPIRKTLVLPLFGDEVTVDVDFRIIEIIERVFDLSADAVISLFSDGRRVQRRHVADVIVGWLAFKELGMKRREIREHVMTCPADALAVYTTSIYAALLFVLNYFDKFDPKANAKKFDDLVTSADWPRIGSSEEEDAKKKPTSKKRSSADASK